MLVTYFAGIYLLLIILKGRLKLFGVWYEGNRYNIQIFFKGDVQPLRHVYNQGVQKGKKKERERERESNERL